MAFRRARRLSSERTMYHGESSVSVCSQHQVARPRELVPALVGFEIHRAQLPLPDRIVDARHEAPFLLLLADLEPDLDQPDAAIDDELLDDRAELEEALVLLGRAEAHDVLDAGAIVPAAVEDHDLAGRPGSARCSAACTSGSSRGPTAPAGRRRERRAGSPAAVIALISPPLPAASRPSRTMMIRSPVVFTQSCRWQSSTCSLSSSFS